MILKYSSNLCNQLGEGCIFDARTMSYYWVDIYAKQIFQLSLDKKITSYLMPDRVSFIFPRKKGGFIVGFTKDIVITENFRDFKLLVEVEKNNSDTRLNDATISPNGSLIFGTMNERSTMPSAAIYSLNDSGIVKLIDNITISNGIACSSTHLYYTDTQVGTIYKCAYHGDITNLEKRELFAKVDIAAGKPDGACLDSEGGYWNARVWGNCIIRIDSDGNLSECINLDIKAPTCVCFGGEDLSDLFISSLSLKHSESDFENYPLTGSALIIEANYSGLPSFEYNF